MRVVSESNARTIYEKDGTRVEMVELDVEPVGLALVPS